MPLVQIHSWTDLLLVLETRPQLACLFYVPMLVFGWWIWIFSQSGTVKRLRGVFLAAIVVIGVATAAWLAL